MKTKKKSHRDKLTGFCDKEILKVDSNHSFLAVISLDSAFEKGGNYYLQVLFKSDDSDEESIKAIKLFSEDVFFREQFWKCILDAWATSK